LETSWSNKLEIILPTGDYDLIPFIDRNGGKHLYVVADGVVVHSLKITELRIFLMRIKTFDSIFSINRCMRIPCFIRFEEIYPEIAEFDKNIYDTVADLLETRIYRRNEKLSFLLH